MRKIIELLCRTFCLIQKDNIKIQESFPKNSILLAEDNPLLVRPIKSLLEQRGYHVTAVEDGNKALNYLKSYTYDWVLLDLVLPEVEEIDLVKDYRRWEKQTNKPYLPIFCLTAYPFKEMAHACKEAGMDYLFEKPFKTDYLKVITEFLTEKATKIRAGLLRD